MGYRGNRPLALSGNRIKSESIHDGWASANQSMIGELKIADWTQVRSAVHYDRFRNATAANPSPTSKSAVEGAGIELKL